MVTLRRTSKRVARGSESAAKSKNPARSKTTRPIPATSTSIPVSNTSNPVNPSIPMAYIPNPVQSYPNNGSQPREAFDFDGIQYSPYFLTSGDNPGISIISEILDGTNFNTWIIAITVALDAKNKLAFVDGSLPRPLETHPYYRIWSRCNSLVKSWILTSVTKDIYASILRFNDASEIWNDLMVRYRITNMPRSYQITQQIWSLQQGATDLSTYYTKLRTLWSDLDGADCTKTCQNCKCCSSYATKAEHGKIIKFLAGLNDAYSSIRSQIIMKKNVPSLAEIYNLLDQDFSQRSIVPIQNASVFNVASVETIPVSVNAAYNNPKTNRPICSHCGYNGHTVDKCYKIHGYPIGFKHKTKAPANSAKPVVAQMVLTETNAADTNVLNQATPLTQDQIQNVIAYFNTQLTSPIDQNASSSNSGGIITALPGSYQGSDDWSW